MELARRHVQLGSDLRDEAVRVVGPLPVHVDSGRLDDQDQVPIGVENLEKRMGHLDFIAVPRLVINERGD